MLGPDREKSVSLETRPDYVDTFNCLFYKLQVYL